jgi:hypothetical protein
MGSLKMNRRTFFKMLNGSFWGSQLLLGKGAWASASKMKTESNSPDSSGIYDKDLHFLNREQNQYPQNPSGYYSSNYQRIFTLKNVDPKSNKAVFSVQTLSGNPGPDLSFSISAQANSLILQSSDGMYCFSWKWGFGLYALESTSSQRILELCPPHDGKTAYLPDSQVTVPLTDYDSYHCSTLRACYQAEGVAASPLDGFAGFCEETLQMDASSERDGIVGRGLDRFINLIFPLGLFDLKTLARVSPSSAAAVLEKAFPNLIGWMLGPAQSAGSGKILLTDCPYRKRLGTYPCEAICGHGIAKHYTEQIGIPVRFDPTVDGYTKCMVTIGND